MAVMAVRPPQKVSRRKYVLSYASSTLISFFSIVKNVLVQTLVLYIPVINLHVILIDSTCVIHVRYSGEDSEYLFDRKLRLRLQHRITET